MYVCEDIIYFLHWTKIYSKAILHKEYLHTFVFVNDDGCRRLFFVFKHYKATTRFVNHHNYVLRQYAGNTLH